MIVSGDDVYVAGKLSNNLQFPWKRRGVMEDVRSGC